MRAGWQTAPLRQVSEVLTGPFGSLLHKSDYVSDGIPLINPINIVDGQIVVGTEKTVNQATLNRLRNYVLAEGDIVFGRRGEIGRCAVIGLDQAGWLCGTGCFFIRQSTKVDSRFLAELLGAPPYRQRLELAATGTTMKNLSNQALQDLSIAFPPLPEQRRIVAILDEAFAGLATATANAEKNLKNAREFFHSYLSSIFTRKGDGWSDRILRDLCDLISGQHIDAKDYNTDGKGLGYLTGPSDFGAMHPVISKWTEVPKRTARKDDILITVKGSGVGSINLLHVDEVAISRQLMAVRATGANRDFLYYFLSLQQSYFQTLANGAAIPGISREDVLDLLIATPDRALQDNLVTKIKDVESQVLTLEDHYNRRLADLSELKQSILRKAFSGELTSPPSQAINEAAE